MLDRRPPEDDPCLLIIADDEIKWLNRMDFKAVVLKVIFTAVVLGILYLVLPR